MKAIVCEAWGSPSSLQVRDMPSPVPGPKQVLVRMRVAAVNFPDALMVAGKYQFKPEFPFSPGGELSGEVIAVGSEVKRLPVGDKVVGITSHRRLRPGSRGRRGQYHSAARRHQR